MSVAGGGAGQAVDGAPRPVNDAGRAMGDVGRPVDDTVQPANDAPQPISDTLAELQERIRARLRDRPAGSYTARLFEGGAALQRRKIGEEAVEVITASDNAEIVAESADLLFHLCVYLEATGLSIDDVYRELRARMK